MPRLLTAAESSLEWPLRDLGCGARIVRLGDDLGLPGLDEDESCDEDDQYRYEEGDNDWFDGRVSYALFRRGVACCRFLLAHGGIGRRGGGSGLDGR
jgi:hypothetical protein